MYAIVKTGGKQYRVEQGQTLLIERLPDPEGATVNLEPLLLRSDDQIFDAAGLAKVEVQAKIVGHVRGPKLRVFKFKPKRGYRRRTGHRQELTQIEVTKIGTRSARASSRSAAEPAPAAAVEKPARTRRASAAGESEAVKPATRRAPPRTTPKEDGDGA
ncbi:MAG TPA: 50S ribosomal protein L21 [Solirubrobacteraceae bacterium]|jgi:large subunit ribosomal protein L21